MLTRYLGSKTEILGVLTAEAARVCSPGDHVVDAFSGSLAVSLAFKRAGYRVTANDINLFSAVLADAYLVATDVPQLDANEVLGRPRVRELQSLADAKLAAVEGAPGFAFLKDPQRLYHYRSLLTLLAHLDTVEAQHLPRMAQRSDFFDAYCEEGARAAFVSSRGRAGRRRFFTPDNARRLDLIEGQLRAWRQHQVLDEQSHATALACLLRAAERVANTQGTYHDFPRNTWDPRAFKAMMLAPPALDTVVSDVAGHRTGREHDSLDFVRTVDRHALLYLDPPYNFRQYSAYYFLPNLLCRYPDLDDPDQYFDELRYVRGQNPNDDFSSTFCKAGLFIDELTRLISSADSDTVMLSYFTGRNHWGDFDQGRDDEGLTRLTELLQSDLFEPGSLVVTEVARTNYASYGGFKARTVAELILTARRSRGRDGRSERTGRRLQPVA